MKLKAMVRGDKLKLEGLSWRENVVMGEYLGVLATGEQLLELLPAFQEEERWREALLKLELRVCRGKRPYAYGNGDGEERYGLQQEVWEQCRYQYAGKWLLDMSSEYWARLSVAEQQEYARCYQQGYARHIGLAVERTFRVNGVEIEMRLIPPGRWWMGSPENEVGRDDDERQHRVVISQGYWLQKTAITQGQWCQATGEQPWLGQPCVEDNERHPATYISWEDIGEKLLARWGEE